ncbi:hypothetical protein [Ralstonia pseudosolanacearum]
MTAQQTGIHHTSRLKDPAKDHLRITLEGRIGDQLRRAQDLPHTQIKGNSKPSRSLLTRRALEFYMTFLLQLPPDSQAAQRENDALHRLA